tara:strand:- start:214 stop:663 length:450 start_codon:yes stop_codon:yes gene_type:complete
MIKNNEPYLIEYNIRMGDPECQVIMPRIKTDIIQIINSAINNRLNKIKIKWVKQKCMTIVLCSKGYPGKYNSEQKIGNLTDLKLNKKSIIYHAGTKLKKKEIVSNGGRVLSVTVLGNSFKLIRNNIIKILKNIKWKDGFYRKDIGWRII